MTTERSANINIGGDEYTLLLTTKATKDIAGRYGGLENLGDKLMKSENFEMAIGEIVWLITLLANQSILVHNLKHKDAPKELLTEEMVELLTTPVDLATYKVAITEALYKGRTASPRWVLTASLPMQRRLRTRTPAPMCSPMMVWPSILWRVQPNPALATTASIRWLRVIPSGILPPCIWAKAADTPKSRPSMV